MCANSTSAVPSVPAFMPRRWKRAAFMTTVLVIAAAFQEALDMRRNANRNYFLGDE